jgi:hypothetical protein
MGPGLVYAAGQTGNLYRHHPDSTGVLEIKDIKTGSKLTRDIDLS